MYNFRSGTGSILLRRQRRESTCFPYNNITAQQCPVRKKFSPNPYQIGSMTAFATGRSNKKGTGTSRPRCGKDDGRLFHSHKKSTVHLRVRAPGVMCCNPYLCCKIWRFATWKIWRLMAARCSHPENLIGSPFLFFIHTPALQSAPLSLLCSCQLARTGSPPEKI